MDMFSTTDKRNSHSKTSKMKKDDSSLLRKDYKRNSNKSKILSKFKGNNKNISINSQKRFKKLYSDNLFDIKRKNSKRSSKKAISSKNRENQESSIMFSKFLRSMDMADSNQKNKYNSRSNINPSAKQHWIMTP